MNQPGGMLPHALPGIACILLAAHWRAVREGGVVCRLLKLKANEDTALIFMVKSMMGSYDALDEENLDSMRKKILPI